MTELEIARIITPAMLIALKRIEACCRAWDAMYPDGDMPRDERRYVAQTLASVDQFRAQFDQAAVALASVEKLSPLQLAHARVDTRRTQHYLTSRADYFVGRVTSHPRFFLHDQSAKLVFDFL